MTVIVAKRENNVLMFATDSLSSAENDIEVVKNPKIFKFGDVLIGGSGSWALPQLIVANLAAEITALEEASHPFVHMITKFAPAVQMLARKNKLKLDSSTLLVAVGLRLFTLECDGAVLEYPESTAVGCGKDLAKGALYALNHSNYTLEEKLNVAIDAACTYDGCCGGPTITLKNEIAPTEN